MVVLKKKVNFILKSFLVACFFMALSCARIQYERQFKKPENPNLSLGEKISFYADQFIGTPYDRILIGLYVDTRRLIADNEVDCMYLVFRSIPLALADGDNKKAFDIACDKMFHDRCKLDSKGFVTNYETRFDYSEDMVMSGKWGKNIYKDNQMTKMKGSRMYKYFPYIPSQEFINNQALQKEVKKGDIVFFVKRLDLRSPTTHAIIGHLGILDVIDGKVYVTHASGSKTYKKPQGKVVKVLLTDYLKDKTGFAGIYISRM